MGRQSLSANERKEILLKTNSRCHICGGKISRDEKWHADHVISYAKGGKHSVENFLPAHALCNSYRRSYLSEELQWILKLGVWFRTLIEEENVQAIEMAERFVKYENVRQARQKN